MILRGEAVKKLFAFVLSFVLSFALLVGFAVPIEAAQPVVRSDVAGHQLGEVIDLIMTRYVGEPLTVDELLEAAMRGMTDILDQYSIYLSASELARFTNSMDGRLRGIGVSMSVMRDGRIMVARVLPDSPALRAGIQLGDVLLYVDGLDIEGMPLDFVTALITNPAYERVVVTFERDGQNISFDILKEEIRSPTVIVERLENEPEAEGFRGLRHFRYMQISSVSQTTGADVRRALSQMQEEGVRGIILDLRGNTGGHLDVTVDIGNQMIPEGTILQTVNQSGRVRTYNSHLTEMPFDNIVVLVNRFTASAAEVLASALQDSGAAIIVGETTFGKGLVQTVYMTQNGGALKLTTEEFYRRNGEAINGIGVVPCVLVDRRTNFDEPDMVLRRGIELLIEGR